MGKFFNQIIYLNVIVALSTAILSAGFVYAMFRGDWWLYGLFAFFSTLAVYNGQRLFKAGTMKETPWLSWVKRNRNPLGALSVLSGLVAGIIFFILWNPNPISISFLMISGIISLFYVVKVRGRNMREIPYLKIHLIALTWVLTLIIFPLFNEGYEQYYIWPAVAHYLYVLAVTIPFDIRDLKYDKSEHRTIPQVIGVGWSKTLSVILLFGFLIIMLTLVDPYLLLNKMFILSVVIQVILVLFMNEKRSDTYCAGAIDGAIALLGLSYFLH